VDFSALFLLIALLLALIAGSCLVVYLFLKKSKKRFTVLIGYVALFLLALAYGRTMYQLFWLDEPLWGAAWTGDEVQVRKLLQRGANPSATWEDDRSAIEAAQEGGHEEIVEILKSAGGK